MKSFKEKIFILVLLAGCAAPRTANTPKDAGFMSGWTTAYHWYKTPLKVYVDPMLGIRVRDAVELAFGGFPCPLFEFTDDKNASQIRFRLDDRKEDCKGKILNIDNNKAAHVSRCDKDWAQITVGKEWADNSPSQVLHGIMLHELGHAMGLDHDEELPGTLMYPTVEPGTWYGFTTEDRDRLVWRYCVKGIQ